MFFKTTDNVELFYETFGSKEDIPVVLVHGFGAEHKMWLPQI
ncbi:MAG: alpha/beta hydrolase, partial [Firmicutes bacterium HGW-Firmicutes-13]